MIASQREFRGTAVSAGIGIMVARGAELYRREVMLPRLIPIDPGLIASKEADARDRVIRMLARALRGERARGRAGHWTYSLDRHIGLLQAFRAERDAQRAERRRARPLR
ncbi:DUF6477 family protein [Prosthecomicrobium sp. N25]|uniref:DUF6477 family protein n=1 Tax=Prosthecomicrobium sp. N25 TaxID=3129254 RepID=UPI00307740F1